MRPARIAEGADPNPHGPWRRRRPGDYDRAPRLSVAQEHRHGRPAGAAPTERVTRCTASPRALLDDIDGARALLADGATRARCARASGSSRSASSWMPPAARRRWPRRCCARSRDPAFTTEIARYNLELNVDPLALTAGCLHEARGDPRRSPRRGPARRRTTWRRRCCSPACCRRSSRSDLTRENMTPSPRYRALSDRLVELSGGVMRTSYSRRGRARGGARLRDARELQHLHPGAPAGGSRPPAGGLQRRAARGRPRARRRRELATPAAAAALARIAHPGLRAVGRPAPLRRPGARVVAAGALRRGLGARLRARGLPRPGGAAPGADRRRDRGIVHGAAGARHHAAASRALAAQRLAVPVESTLLRHRRPACRMCASSIARCPRAPRCSTRSRTPRCSWDSCSASRRDSATCGSGSPFATHAPTFTPRRTTGSTPCCAGKEAPPFRPPACCSTNCCHWRTRGCAAPASATRRRRATWA